METVFEKLGWKKFSAIVIGITLIFLFFLFLSFQEADRSSTSTSRQNENNKSGEGIGNRQSDVILNKSYTSDIYTILYPDNFNIVTFEVEPPIIDNVKLIENVTQKEISITVFDKATQSLSSLSVPLENNSFTKEEFNMNGLTGVLYEGGINETHHQKTALIDKGSWIIRMQYTYATDKDPFFEAIFDSILLSFN